MEVVLCILFNKTNHLFGHFIFISWVVLGMSACQSTLDIAGGEHKVVTEKWLALSKYAESNIEKFGVTITAQLANTNDNKFRLTNFRINTLATKQDINLLTPYFENKYICSPRCYQLIEYVNFTGENGATLLTNYFDRHEFELFKFYGDIYLLNKQLRKLAEFDEPLLKNYLLLLAYQSISFESAKEFIQFLTHSLTINALERFAEDPEDLFFHMLKRYKVINDGLVMSNSSEQDEWADVSKELDDWSDDPTKESDHWVEVSSEQDEWVGASIEQDKWTILTEPPELALLNNAIIQPDTVWVNESPEQHFSGKDMDAKVALATDTAPLYWLTAKENPILVGHNVCSFKESFFGVVIAKSDDKVTVNILGQAKIISEGIVYPANAGDLFTMAENLYFIPLTEKRTFDKSDIASCSIE